ncbi:Uncharacterised protein [Chlamydia trachomatis]|nr:Uncharacterised protein [Chlamydia trachomatis]
MNIIKNTLGALVAFLVNAIMSLFSSTRTCKDTSTDSKSGVSVNSEPKSVILRLASTELIPSVRIGILYYSTIRFSFDRLSKLFGCTQIPQDITLGKFRYHSVMLRFGPSVIVLRPQQTDTLVHIFRDILISLRIFLNCLARFHLRRINLSSLVRTETFNYLRLYSKVETFDALQPLMLSVVRDLNIVFPRHLRVTLDSVSSIRLMVFKLLRLSLGCFVQQNGSSTVHN